MEFHSLVDGKMLPEIYHFGFDGTHFVIFVDSWYWKQFVDLSGEGTYYASNQGLSYVPPSFIGGAFGQYGLAVASHDSDKIVCIRIPAVVENFDANEHSTSILALGNTLASILFLLSHMLYETSEKNDTVVDGKSQLFVVETYVSRELMYHGAGLELSLSPIARKYLEKFGDNVRLDKVVQAMEKHYQSGQKVKRKMFLTAIDAHLRTNGVLHMHTIGQCACLGTVPHDFGERGCYLSSHNVDTVSQQFNLLVGIASIWQMVRNDVFAEIG